MTDNTNNPLHSTLTHYCSICCVPVTSLHLCAVCTSRFLLFLKIIMIFIGCINCAFTSHHHTSLFLKMKYGMFCVHFPLREWQYSPVI